MRKLTEQQFSRDNKGSVMALALLMVVLLSVGGIALLRLALDARLQAVRIAAAISARAAADAGVTKAIFDMNKSLIDESWSFNDIASQVEAVLPHTNASYSYTIDELAHNYEFRIASTGQSGHIRRVVSTTLVREPGLFEYAVFALGYAHPKHPKPPRRLPERPKPPKKGGKLHVMRYNIDGYNSDPKQSYTGNLQIRTNCSHKKAIKLQGELVVHGDVVVGPGAKPERVVDLKGGASIGGDIYTAADALVLPQVIVPSNLLNQKAKKYKYQPNVPLSGKIKLSELKISDVQEITGNCEIYVAGDVEVEKGGQLIIGKNSSVTLYVGGKLDVKNDSEGITNLTGDPTKLIIYGTDSCSHVKIEQNGEPFYGAVYAPFAKVEMKDGSDLYGAFVGWDVKLKNKTTEISTFYYDEALRMMEVPWSHQGTRFRVMGWHEE